ncbi:GNAT family N-acetyltransferase [SAR86 cluster bacterium]|nr:GNAT family N-acetyltransferase [SAR86 cluster bacterium]
MSSLLESVIIKKFQDLNKLELYKIMQLRIEVFVVEQDCPYQDLDGLDELGTHLWLEEDNEIMSYLRINPPETRFDEVSFGRIVTKKSVRKKGLSEAIILKSLEIVEQENLGPVRISAQSYLENYYSKFGFVKCSDEYLEDNIPHVEMLRK